MKKLSLIVTIFIILFLGCKKEEGTVIARVGKTTLTLEKFESALPIEYLATISHEDKISLIENWIGTELVYEKAISEGTLENSEIADQIEQLKKQIVINYWLNQNTYDKISVSDIDVKDFYEFNRQAFDNEIKVAHIVSSTKLDAIELKKRIDEGADFSKIAREYSIDNSGADGGVIGYVKLGDIALTGFDDAAFSLREIGDISDIIRTERGFHIIKLLGMKRLSNPPKFEDIKEGIKNQLLMAKQIAVVDSLVKQLREEIPVEVYYELIK